MPLVPTIITAAMDAAFVAGMLAMDEAAEANSAAGSQVNSPEECRAIGATAFAAVAGPAIDTYIRSQTLIVPPGQAVATAGSPAAQVGATTAPSLPIPVL